MHDNVTDLGLPRYKIKHSSPLTKLPRRSSCQRYAPYALLLALIFLLTRGISSLSSRSPWKEGTFVLDQTPRPEWLAPDHHDHEPVVIRLAIMTRVFESNLRKEIRRNVIQGVGTSNVKLEYGFFVGHPQGWLAALWVGFWIHIENRMGNDVVVLDLEESLERMSEKRYKALQWAGKVPSTKYDYFMTMDSDTFCRFNALVKRLPHLMKEKKLEPRNQPIMLGKMGEHLTYFNNTVQDGNRNKSDHDTVWVGPWFPYPIGIGYMLSSNLVDSMLSTKPALPHHVHYPSDDVIIGAWVAALRHFPDPEQYFASRDTDAQVYPKPYYPHSIDTLVIDDKPGWQDIPGRGNGGLPIGWDVVCLHKVKTKEFSRLRGMKEYRDDWE